MGSIRIYSLFDVIACARCQSDEDGNLLIGAPALAREVFPRIYRCPSCRAHLFRTETVAVGIPYRRCMEARPDAA